MDYILIIQTVRIGKDKTTRKCIIEGHNQAIEVIREMLPQETLLLFKPYTKRVNKRRTKQDRRK